MADITAVCFDLDSTLCRRDDRAFHRALFERVDADPFFDPPDVNAVDPAALPPADSVREFWEHIFRAVAEDAGADPDHAPVLADATMDLLVEDPPVAFTDGAEDALRYARKRFDTGLVTRGSEEMQAAKVEALGIGDAFDAQVFCGPATDVEGKPAPEPFRRALDELDASPEEAVYVGDSLESDVAGARSVGMRSVWVPPGDVSADPNPDPEPTYRLDSLRELSTVV